jgi:hypothetical protein
LSGRLALLGGLAALSAAAPTVTAVRPTVSSSAAAARWTGEKTRKERVKLGDPIHRDLHRDLLELRCSGGYVGIHYFSCCCLRELAYHK